MLSSAQVIKTLQQQKPLLTAYGVSELGLFGSFADGSASEKSDIDILIDFSANNETYQNFINACELLENSFKGIRVDVVTKKGLSPFLCNPILNSVRYV
ncbi:MAG: nucleotidyltransferase domain-containing protein [Flavobacteriales bacterium]|nr:nucleotidyltransferase domain-containing protein [Flavobacteriales bacterium]